jgi:SET domain-containing protein
MIKYEVTIIEKKGRGLKALKTIQEGEIVLENHALRISNVRLNDEVLRKHVMFYQGNQNIIMLGEATLVNHDDNPNCEILIVVNNKLPKVVLVALRKIKKNEELTIDYGPDYPKEWLKCI